MKLNRIAPTSAFAMNGEWFQVLKKGEWPHSEPKRNGRGEVLLNPDGKAQMEEIVQVVDEAACQAIVAKFNAERATIPNHPGMLLDYDHFSYDPDKSTEAAGWIEELQAREDGVWARPRFSNDGRAKVESGSFRLISPVLEDFESLGGNRLRPRRMDSAGLTNRPNIWGMQPWANRSAPDSGSGVPRKSNAAGELKNMDHKQVLCSLLGLGADATDEQIAKAAEAMKGAKSSTDDVEMERKNRELAALKVDVTSLRAENKALNTKLTEARAANVERLVEENKDAFEPEFLKNRLQADYEGTVELLGKRNRKTEGGKESGKAGTYKPVHNRDNGARPENPNGDEASKSDEILAARISNRADYLMRTYRIPFGQAWNRARSDVAINADGASN